MFRLLNKALQKHNQMSSNILHQVAVLVEDRTTQKFEHNKVERELMFNFQKIAIYCTKYFQIIILLWASLYIL